eukprot:CAMPEP_0178414628 /NCGR_PEP_ID=MMETSP0689_2-20121128/23134_1 /TAXON_ID=160604 /ORGANISM="Amphidinium massartii, Strain CS-259" /LENGTH=377 /DNA_ID=CAMNT_0020035923 /DNA_START=177 /DNA_END=1308 /DNA_ORIENTATION=-
MALAVTLCCFTLVGRPAFCVAGRQQTSSQATQSLRGNHPEVFGEIEVESRTTSPALSSLVLVPMAAVAAWQLSASRGRQGQRGQSRTARHAVDADKYSSVFLIKEEFSGELKALRSACGDMLDETHDDDWLVRFLLEKKGDVAEAKANIKKVLDWRAGEGKDIVERAAKAVAEAQADGGWNNAPVFAAAPYSDKIGKYITPQCLLVLSTSKGDIISMIRAAAVPSKEMMAEVSVSELIDFFIYAREVNFLIATKRTKESSRLCRLVAANDLTGVSSFPDKDFQEALSGASAKAVELYPGLAGPTVLLNLPFLARAIVGLLLPLFPGAVKEKVKFATFGMDYMVELTDVLKEPTKSTFLKDFEKVLKSESAPTAPMEQ